MYCQLGTTPFDGAKSFVSFSSDEEAVIVEHALMNRRARLQPAGIGLRNISVTLFLHQQFCKVQDEISKLRNSKNTFEILTLLWGNGRVEGDFVITNLNETKTHQDSIGNTIAASVSLSLKEFHTEDKLSQKQLDAQKNAFAVGDKTPPTRSNRVNPTPCQRQISDLVSGIQANAGAADRYCQGYTNIPGTNARLKFVLGRINEDVQKVITASADPGSCAHSVSGLSASCNNVKAKVSQLLADIKVNETQYPNLVITPVNITLKSHNTELQAAVRNLASTASPLVKSSIINR